MFTDVGAARKMTSKEKHEAGSCGHNKTRLAQPAAGLTSPEPSLEPLLRPQAAGAQEQEPARLSSPPGRTSPQSNPVPIQGRLDRTPGGPVTSPRNAQGASQASGSSHLE